MTTLNQIENALEQLNVKAVELAVEAARETGAIVAGNNCNTWEYDPSNLKASEDKARSIFREQVQWAKAGGAGFIIAETFTHYGEALLSLEEIKLHPIFGDPQVKRQKYVECLYGPMPKEKQG